MRTLTLLLTLVRYAQTRTVAVLYSTETPFNTLPVLNLVGMAESVTAEFITGREEIAAVQQEVVLDYLYLEGLSALARSGREAGTYYRMWGEASSELYGRAFSAYIQAMNLSGVLLIGDPAHAVIVEELYATSPFLYRDFTIVPSDANLDFALQYVGRLIKPQGFNLLAFFLSPQTTLLFLQALEAKKLNKAGYAFILSQDSGRYRFLSNTTSGVLGNGVQVVGEETEGESSLEELEARRLRELLNCIAVQCSPQPKWCLFYTRANTLVKAASTPSAITSNTSILFPGNTTVFPSLTKAQIRASVNYQILNPDGTQFYIAPQVMRGFQVAFEEANNRSDLLPHYYLEDHSVDFCGAGFNFNSSLAKVTAAQHSLGLIYMAPPVSESIQGMTQVFNSLHISMPMTSGILDSVLSDPSTYPFYVRTRPSSKYVCTVMARMIQYFSWSKVAFLYAIDNGDSSDIYRSFLAVKGLFAINITNPESTRGLPALLDNFTIGIVNASLQAILASDTRIIIIAHNYNFVIMDQLYDLGVREGYVQLYISGLADAVLEDIRYYKRRVVSKGALQFFPRLFVGEVGHTVKQQLLQRDGKGMFPNTCLHYDCAYLYFYATQYLLDSGQDYEDPYLIMKSMRDTYFHGCSGFVKIETGTNDRAEAEIVITNFQYNSENDTYELKEVGSFNPFSTQLYQFTSPIQWPDDQPTYADTKPYYQNCSFLEEVVREVPLQYNIGVCISLGITLYTLVLAVILGCKWRGRRVLALSQPEPIAVEDVLVFLTVLSDYFQLASLGPDLTAIGGNIEFISAAVGVNLNVLIELKEGVYWVVLDVGLGLAGVWCVLCILALTPLERKMCSWYVYWTELLMPVVGSTLFLPIISLFSYVFLCSKGVSDSLTDSFFNYDCGEFCWRGKHLGYAVGCAVTLPVFILLALYTRPLWQDKQSNAHIKAQPWALLVKYVVLVLLIETFHMFKESNPSIHAYIYLSILLFYICFLLVTPYFNYPRLNLWQLLLTVALLSLAVAAHLSNTLSSTVTPYLVPTLLGVYAGLGVLGVVLQTCVPRFKSRLFREKGRDVRGLFVFAFTWGRRAQAGLQRFYITNHIKPFSNVTIFERDIMLEVQSSQ